MNIYLTSASDTVLFTAEISLLNKSVKASFRSFKTLVNDSVLFCDSSTLSQTFKAVKKLRARVWSFNSHCLCNSADWPRTISCSWEILMPLVLFRCSVTLASFFQHVCHCNCGPVSSIAVAKFFQSWGIILFWVAYKFNICFILSKCISHEMIAFLSIFKSNISIEFQLTSTKPWGCLWSLNLLHCNISHS